MVTYYASRVSSYSVYNFAVIACCTVGGSVSTTKFCNLLRRYEVVGGSYTVWYSNIPNP
jgi:hypothetical protein